MLGQTSPIRTVSIEHLPTNDRLESHTPSAEHHVEDDSGNGGSIPVGISEQNLGHRLVIVKLVLENFKSYAGRVEIGPFHNSFTSIVGPNGSGKSNVIDALLFVFGFKAKRMRQEKMSHLIHSSSAHPNLTKCRVEVHFQLINEFRNPGISNSQFAISRIVEKTDKADKSMYKISENGRERLSSYTEVTALLRQYGVDLDHKRFLILQGEVELISQMKPKATNENEDGLLEYLEDIIGTTQYKSQIDELGKKLEDVNQSRVQKLDRVKLLEKQRNNLEDKKVEAQAWVDLENTKTQLQHALWQVDLHKLKNEIVTGTAKVENLVENLEAQKTSRQSLDDEINEARKEHKQIAVEAEAAKSAMQNHKNAIKDLERGDVVQQEKLKHAKAKQKKLQTSKNECNAQIQEHQYWLGNYDHDMEKNEKNLDETKSKMITEQEKLNEIQESLKGKTQHLQDELILKQQQLAPSTEKCTVLRASLENTQAELKMAEDQVTTCKSSLKTNEEQLVKHSAFLVKKTSELDEATTTKNQAETRIPRIKAELKNHETTARKLRYELGQCKRKEEEAKSTNKSVQERSKIHREFNRLRDQNIIPGIIGRLGDLGTIDNKYDVAVTTACPQLDNIVVETVESGQKCIEHLKRGGLGRATFICLDKIKDMEKQSQKYPEGVPRLVDLIKPSHERFRKAFFQVLGNTLVADSMETANRIAFGPTRFRVVTLAGQIIDAAGTMSGGGRNVQKGGMSSNAASNTYGFENIQELEDTTARAEAALNEHSETVKTLQAELEQLEAEFPVYCLAFSKLEIDVHAANESIQNIKKLVSQNKTDLTNAEDSMGKVQHLHQVIIDKKQQLEQLQKSMEPLEKDIEQLQDQILAQGGARLRAQGAIVESLKAQVESLESSHLKMQVEKTTRSKAVTKLEKELEKTVNELNSLSESFNSLEELQMESRQKLYSLQKSADQEEMNHTEIKEKLDEIASLLAEKAALQNEHRRSEFETVKSLEAARNSVQQKTRIVAKLESDLSKLALTITGFEDEVLQLTKLTEEEALEINVDLLRGELNQIEEKLKKTPPNLSVLDEYRKLHNDYCAHAADLDQLTASREAAKEAYEGACNSRLNEFMNGFNAISLKLKEMYQIITMGGNAELELVDSLDPFSEGIVFSVMPPKKSWKNICNLSGGEKTLSSLALVFALHHFKPTPLYVMDEIDAALDFRNVSIVANYIKERTKNAQFIIISLRNNMFELADRLVGIYKTHDMTKSITINPNM
ncbi:RecF/RecN/SMC [Cladochytrium replicatum]|nr:RecF/RecN/SMC [Cladochytrium replicatum]